MQPVSRYSSYYYGTCCLFSYIINSPIQDCLFLAFQHLQAKKSPEIRDLIALQLQEMEFLQYLVHLTLQQDSISISLATGAQICQILKLSTTEEPHFMVESIMQHGDFGNELVSIITLPFTNPNCRSLYIDIISLAFCATQKSLQCKPSNFTNAIKKQSNLLFNAELFKK